MTKRAPVTAENSRSSQSLLDLITKENRTQKYVIEGGVPLKGTIRPMGSKNEALPAIAATLLTDEPVILRNVPEIQDCLVMMQILKNMGASIDRLEPNVFQINTSRIDTWRLDEDLCGQVRASILFVGPMLTRKGRVEIPPPGGDVIGRRRLDTHFDGLISLGARVNVGNRFFLECPSLKGAPLFLDEASVTGTENILMAAVLAKGHTCIRNAACEPHVQGLARMLNSMGARIGGIGSNYLSIDGVSSLKGTDYTIGSDYLEIGSFIGAAAVTGGEISITNVNQEDMHSILLNYRKLGIETYYDGESTLVVPGHRELLVEKEMLGTIPKIDDAPWPQFPTDLMSIAIVVATQAKGTVLFFEKMFDGRMFFVDHLIAMGAQIILCDPHRVVVVGPSPLFGCRVESPDIRAGMALLLAALAAQGDTEIYNIRQIDRGYQSIDQRLSRIGAKITRKSIL